MQVFDAVMLIIAVLGCMAIFSLLLSDANAQTYEYGMLRALGMRTSVMGQILLFQALYFAIPGITIALLLATVADVPLASFLSALSGFDIKAGLQPSTLALALSLGVIIPIVSNIVPIRRSLSRTLSDSLDLYHQSHSETNVKMERLEDVKLSLSQTSLSLTLVVVGGVIYYVIPLAFIFQNIDLLLSSLNAILLSALAGMTIISAVVQPLLERFSLHALVVGPDSKLKHVVRKNLIAHRTRSAKTALMFSLSISFIVFAGTMFSLQADAAMDNLKQYSGADVLLSTENVPLDHKAIAEYLRNRSDIVVGWTTTSFSLKDVDPPVWHTYVSNLVRFPFFASTDITAVDANFLDVTYSNFFRVSQGRLPVGTDYCRTLNSNSNLSVVADQIDSLSGQRVGSSAIVGDRVVKSFDCMAPTSYVPALSVDLTTPLRVNNVVRTALSAAAERSPLYYVYLCNVQAYVTKMPLWFFSAYGTTAKIASRLVVGMGTWEALLRDMWVRSGINITLFPSDVPRRHVFVKLKPGVDADVRTGLSLIDCVGAGRLG